MNKRTKEHWLSILTFFDPRSELKPQITTVGSLFLCHSVIVATALLQTIVDTRRRILQNDAKSELVIHAMRLIEQGGGHG